MFARMSRCAALVIGAAVWSASARAAEQASLTAGLRESLEASQTAVDAMASGRLEAGSAAAGEAFELAVRSRRSAVATEADKTTAGSVAKPPITGGQASRAARNAVPVPGAMLLSGDGQGGEGLTRLGCLGIVGMIAVAAAGMGAILLTGAASIFVPAAEAVIPVILTATTVVMTGIGGLLLMSMAAGLVAAIRGKK